MENVTECLAIIHKFPSRALLLRLASFNWEHKAVKVFNAGINLVPSIVLVANLHNCSLTQFNYRCPIISNICLSLTC